MKQAFDIIPLAAAKTKPWINSEQNIHSHTIGFSTRQRECYIIPSPHSIHSKTHNQHPTRPQPPHQTPSSQKRHTRHRSERAVEEAVVAPPPPCRVSTFLVGKRPVKVCKKLALSVCDDMRLPLRSMAYGWG